MGAIDEDLWKILAYRLQGTPLRGHGLLQSEIYPNIVVETTDGRSLPQVISRTDWRCNRGVWCAVGDEESVSGMDAARQAPMDGFTASLSSPYRAARSLTKLIPLNPYHKTHTTKPKLQKCSGVRVSLWL